MTELPTSLVWKKLALEKVKFVTRERIDRYAQELGKRPMESIKYLQKNGYIHRIFRGIFYVSSLEEREYGGYDFTVREMISQGLKIKGVQKWYFGLQSALKLNLMTHEVFNIDYVITNSYRTTKIVRILGSQVKFYVWSDRLHIPGSVIEIRTKNNCSIRYSNPEKTVLDIAYKRYIDNLPRIQGPINEYWEMLDKKKVTDYIKRYPLGFQKELEGLIQLSNDNVGGLEEVMQTKTIY